MAPEGGAHRAAGEEHAVGGDVTQADALAGAGLFNAGMVEKLKCKALNGRATSFKDNTAFMGVLSTQLWHRTFAASQQPRRTETG